MTITHVCMSDLHFGAETSLLTELNENFEPEYSKCSPVLSCLMACLRDLMRIHESQRRPTLVLAGDVLELALSRTNEAAMTFEKFLTLAFPGGDDDLFDREVLYIPGNHDHHLWEIARETHYLNYLRTIPAGQPLGEEWHITRLYRREGEDFPEQRLLTGLANRYPSLRDVRFSTAYPNMGLRSADGKRSVIFTHGHFVEPLYSLMSQLKKALFPRRGETDTVLELELENFAWIDFFWSTMGRSGEVGDDVQRIYEMLGTPAGRMALSKRLAAGVVDRFFREDWIPDTAQQVALDVVFDGLLQRAAERERAHAGALLGPGATEGLTRYISGPLLRQVGHECRHTRAPEAISADLRPHAQAF